MTLSWSGKGYFISIANIAAAVATVACLWLLRMPLDSRRTWAWFFGVSGMLSGIAIFLVVRRIEAQPARVLIDPRTGLEFRVPASAGTFGHMPAIYHAYLNPPGGLLLAYLLLNTRVLEMLAR